MALSVFKKEKKKGFFIAHMILSFLGDETQLLGLCSGNGTYHGTKLFLQCPGYFFLMTTYQQPTHYRPPYGLCQWLGGTDFKKMP